MTNPHTPNQPASPAPRPDANPLGALLDFSFTRFATPGIVKVVYILTVVAAVGTWLLSVLGALGMSRFDGGGAAAFVTLLFGWIPALLAIAFTRFVLEGIVALIRIHEKVTEIADRQRTTSGGA